MNKQGQTSTKTMELNLFKCTGKLKPCIGVLQKDEYADVVDKICKSNLRINIWSRKISLHFTTAMIYYVLIIYEIQ